MMIHCAEGIDRSAAVALAILCRNFNPELERGSCETKVDVERMVARMIEFRRKANPTGASVKAVKGWLFERKEGKKDG